MAHDQIGTGALSESVRRAMPVIGSGGVTVEGRNIALATVLADLIRTPGVRVTLAEYGRDTPSDGMPSGFRRLGPDLRTCVVEGLFTHATRRNLGLEVWELAERLEDGAFVEIPRRYHLYRDGERMDGVVLHAAIPLTEAGWKLHQKLSHASLLGTPQNSFYPLSLDGLRPVPTQWVSNLRTVGLGVKLREMTDLRQALLVWKDEYRDLFRDKPYLSASEPRTVPRVCPERHHSASDEESTTERVSHITFSLVDVQPAKPSSLYGMGRASMAQRILDAERRLRALEVTVRCLAIAFAETLSHNAKATFGLKWEADWAHVPRSWRANNKIFREATLPGGDRLCVTRWVGAK